VISTSSALDPRRARWCFLVQRYCTTSLRDIHVWPWFQGGFGGAGLPGGHGVEQGVGGRAVAADPFWAGAYTRPLFSST